MRKVEWPGVGPCILRVLSRQEIQECKAAAHERFRTLKMPVDVTTFGDFEEEVANQLLFRACRDPDRPDDLALATSADELREYTTVDEFAAVFTLYTDLQSEVDPSPTEITPELIGEIEQLIKKKDASRLNAYGSSMLVRCLISGEFQPSTSPTGNSSNMH